MEELVPEGVDVLPTHPMFGPRIRSLAGQVVVLTPLRRSKWVDRAVSFLKGHGARVLVTSPEKHDRMMSVVQVLTHFAYISIALTIRDLSVDVRESRRFASPIYNLMLDTIARIVSQNPYLAYSIQVYNRYGEDVRKAFVGAVERLEDLLRHGERDDFVRWMSFAAKGLDDVEASLGRSDKAIFALNRELDVLKDSIGKEVGLRHIYSGNVHVGVLESVDPDFVVLRVGKRRVRLKVSNIQVLSRYPSILMIPKPMSDCDDAAVAAVSFFPSISMMSPSLMPSSSIAWGSRRAIPLPTSDCDNASATLSFISFFSILVHLILLFFCYFINRGYPNILVNFCNYNTNVVYII